MPYDAESISSLHRRGAISDKQMSKHGLKGKKRGAPAITRGTRAQASKMAGFEDQGGDEGSGRQRGIDRSTADHINKHKPPSNMSKGAKAGPERGPAPVDEIDDGHSSGPSFLASAKATARSGQSWRPARAAARSMAARPRASRACRDRSSGICIRSRSARATSGKGCDL